jgi:hypothetical protein
VTDAPGAAADTVMMLRAIANAIDVKKMWMAANLRIVASYSFRVRTETHRFCPAYRAEPVWGPVNWITRRNGI